MANFHILSYSFDIIFNDYVTPDGCIIIYLTIVLLLRLGWTLLFNFISISLGSGESDGRSFLRSFVNKHDGAPSVLQELCSLVKTFKAWDTCSQNAFHTVGDCPPTIWEKERKSHGFLPTLGVPIHFFFWPI